MWLFFWIIGKIPATFWLMMAIGGSVLFLAGGILGRLPPFKAYAVFIKPIGIILSILGIYMYGGASINDHYQKMIAEYEQKIKIAEEQSAAVNTVIEERIRYETQIIRDNQIVYQDRIIEVATEVDGQCKVHPEIVKILNNAAENPLTDFRNTANRAAGGNQ
jgi:hypothetical protein